MNREFLTDYEEREKQDILSFIKNVSEGKFSKSQMFPSERRFKNLHPPITYRGGMSVPIWSLASFSGSAIIPLMPIERENFEEFHGFRVDQIDQIVTFAEETGKIQFVLMRNPTDYCKLNFLDPIFERLRPPQFIGIPIGEFASHDVLTKYYKEFSTIEKSGFRNYVRKTSRYSSNKKAFDTLMTNLRGNYMLIRAIAASDISKDFEEAFTSDYERGMEMMNLMNLLILRPLRNPLRCVEAYHMNVLGRAHQFAAQHETKPQSKLFPCEIGSLLMRKLTHYPESLEACKQLTAQYDEQDVLKLFNAVNEGILKNQPDIVVKKEHDLATTLDNIWEDKSLQKRISGIRFGVPLVLGAIGTAVAGLSGTYVGLLSGLGFDVLDKILEFKEEALSENISKAFASRHQVIIFDFQKKYSLKGK